MKLEDPKFLPFQLTKWQGREEELFATLVHKYGPEPELRANPLPTTTLQEQGRQDLDQTLELESNLLDKEQGEAEEQANDQAKEEEEEHTEDQAKEEEEEHKKDQTKEKEQAKDGEEEEQEGEEDKEKGQPEIEEQQEQHEQILPETDEHVSA